MSKKTVKSQASSARAASGAFGGTFGQAQGPFRSSSTTFGSVTSSLLSYVYEPPALNEISDPNIIVAFKNVQKKDATTKTKALEDLQSHVGSSQEKGVEEAVLEAWIMVYPRTSIDSSRRVRQLAHIFHGQIAISCGKRLAKYMPTIVSTWLAGHQDPDKAVSRAAQDSFNQVFAAEEKSKNVWRVYNQAIVEYAENVVVNETETTLSDMRTTSPDDATSKYARVAGCAVTMLTSLIDLVAHADMEKSRSTLTNLIGSEKLWKLANHEDAFVRRAIFRLSITCLDGQLLTLNPSLISLHLLNKGLQTSQTGSSLDFVKALVRLSGVMPTVWTSNYQGTGKKSASHRLLYFLRRGSQGGSVNFWSHISQLLKLIPGEVLFASSVEPDPEPGNESSDFQMLPVLEALRAGVTSKDEPQSNATPAWNSYLDVCEFIAFSNQQYVQSNFVQRYLSPLIHQFIRPSSALVHWTVAGPQRQLICAEACDIAFLINPEISQQEWQTISSQLVEDFQTSLPEQSKDYIESQDSIAGEALRWYCLQAVLFGGNPCETFIRTVRLQSVHEITAAISVLTTRIGKPYGVAAALHTLAQKMPELVLNESPTKNALVSFAENDIPHLMLSPSAPYLIRLLDTMEDYVDLYPVFVRCIESIEGSVESSAGQTAMTTLLASPSFAKAGLLSTTANKVLARATADVLVENDQLNSKILMAALQNTSAPKELTDDVLSFLTEGISIEQSSQASLRMLEFTTKHNRTALRNFATQSKGSHLIAKLLSASEGPDISSSQQAKHVLEEIESALETPGDTAQNTLPLLEAIQREFRTTGTESLSIESLAGLAERLLKQTPATDMKFITSRFPPAADDWKRALEPFMTTPLNLALAMTNPFGAAIRLIQSDIKKGPPKPPMTISYDDDDQSHLLRNLRFAMEAIKKPEFSEASEDWKVTLFYHVALTAQIAADNISISGAMPLWITDNGVNDAKAVQLIDETQKDLADLLQSASMSSRIPRILAKLLQNSEGSSSSSYYHAKAYLTVIDVLSESKRQLFIANRADRIKTIHNSPNLFADMAVVMSCDSKDAVRACNELLSWLTDQKFEMKDAEGQRDGFRRLLLMNCLLQRSDDLVHEIPQQRLIFYVQHVIGQSASVSFDPLMEIVRSLTVILPAIKDIYGSFWGKALDFTKTIQQYCLDDNQLMGYHACFKLCAILANANMLEANDDLLDAWNDRKQSIMQGAIRLLEKASRFPDHSNSPRRIFNELLHRLLEGCGQYIGEDMDPLFSVLGSESGTLQRTAFELLHEQIPLKQEQVSIDKALTKNYHADLPDELRSLIMTAPTSFELPWFHSGNMLLSLQSYLLSWILIFDHWRNASNALQVDYAQSLCGPYLEDLLNLTFTILIDPGGKAVDVSKFDIEAYTADAESFERDTHWLLSHLYFLCLKYLPTRSKAWWRDRTSRQTNIIVESWTQKYVSKHIIASELDAVREWGAGQVNSDQPFTIKVSSSASEITASLPVDEDSIVLAIRLPPSYPLARAEVVGVRRVGIPEKKWISWIRNTQGELTIASDGGANALIDCLQAWRKTVTTTMKAQTECAICYSVVATDRTLPSKVCKTCKNKFHGSCLYKWFSSSNSSSCPLCRNTFSYS